MSGARPRVVVATSNVGKLREFREILADLDVEWVSLAEAGKVDFPEEGYDYEANAVAKARAAADQLGLPALADDSGLEVEGLEGAPGPGSARYGGEGLDPAGRVAHLLSEMADLAGDARRARFVCVAALATPKGVLEVADGACPGSIRTEPTGRGGFGYDPVFEVAGRGVTMAELPAEEKNRVSHRSRALQGLRAAIAALGEPTRS
jgi:XTP/dITP diphosphohydrolase